MSQQTLVEEGFEKYRKPNPTGTVSRGDGPYYSLGGAIGGDRAFPGPQAHLRLRQGPLQGSGQERQLAVRGL